MEYFTPQNVVILAVILTAAWLGIRYLLPVLFPGKGAEFETLIKPWAQMAVSAAFRYSEQIAKETGQPLDGPARQKIALDMYDKLPANIGPFNTELLKRTLLPPETWAKMVETAYQQAKQFSDN